MFSEVALNPALILVALLGVYLELKVRQRSTWLGVLVSGLLAAVAGYLLLMRPYLAPIYFEAAIPLGLAYATAARLLLTKTKLLD